MSGKKRAVSGVGTSAAGPKPTAKKAKKPIAKKKATEDIAKIAPFKCPQMSVDDENVSFAQIMELCPSLSPEESRCLANEYLIYIKLKADNEDKLLCPPKIVDALWHAHILHTKTYAAFCQRNFGRFIHHTPGLGSAANYAETVKAYLKVFPFLNFEAKMAGQETVEVWTEAYGDSGDLIEEDCWGDCG